MWVIELLEDPGKEPLYFRQYPTYFQWEPLEHAQIFATAEAAENEARLHKERSRVVPKRAPQIRITALEWAKAESARRKLPAAWKNLDQAIHALNQLMMDQAPLAEEQLMRETGGMPLSQMLCPQCRQQRLRILYTAITERHGAGTVFHADGTHETAALTFDHAPAPAKNPEVRCSTPGCGYQMDPDAPHAKSFREFQEQLQEALRSQIK